MTPLSARRRYALVSFLTWLPPGLMMGPMVLLMTERGLSLPEVGVTVTVFSVVTVSLELPTGGLSDVIGRRLVLAASAAVSVVAMATLAFATTLWAFAAAAVLKGVARALSSGPAEAWYVDTLHALEGPAADLRPGLARGSALGSVALCAGILTGGFVPLVVPPSLIFPLAAPALLASLAAAVLLVVVVLALPEPPHARRSPALPERPHAPRSPALPERPHARRSSLAAVLREVPQTVVSGVRLATGGPVLRRLMLYAVANGVALTAVELLTPGRLAALAGTAELGTTAYALVAAAGFLGSSAGYALAPGLARAAGGNTRGAILGVAAAALSLGVLAATAGLTGAPGMVTAGAAYVLMFAGISAAGLFTTTMTHEAVTAAERTTVTSISSLSLQAGGALSNLALGLLAAGAGVSAAWGLVAVLVLAASLLFVRMPVRVAA
ncbi:MFS transporter [Nonomuraea typhae]|uniref:MFS transporter n=1 Tax=Nonomuraea typhae TaxID=2603600 RepID=UPI0012FC3818|nr:MFS transporter [Nonomuraea typhae]